MSSRCWWRRQSNRQWKHVHTGLVLDLVRGSVHRVSRSLCPVYTLAFLCVRRDYVIRTQTRPAIEFVSGEEVCVQSPFSSSFLSSRTPSQTPGSMKTHLTPRGSREDRHGDTSWSQLATVVRLGGTSDAVPFFPAQCTRGRGRSGSFHRRYDRPLLNPCKIRCVQSCLFFFRNGRDESQVVARTDGHAPCSEYSSRREDALSEMAGARSLMAVERPSLALARHWAPTRRPVRAPTQGTVLLSGTDRGGIFYTCCSPAARP